LLPPEVQEKKSLQQELRGFPEIKVHVSAKLLNGERVVAGQFRGRTIRSSVDIQTSRGMVYGEVLLLFASGGSAHALVRTFKTSHSRRGDNLARTKLQALERTGHFKVVDLKALKHHVHIVPDFSNQNSEGFLLNPYVNSLSMSFRQENVVE
jgi:hypothetical protein